METQTVSSKSGPAKPSTIKTLLTAIIRLQNLDLEIEIFDKELALTSDETSRKELDEVRRSHLKEREQVQNVIRNNIINDLSLLSRIERLQKRYNGFAVVPVVENACYGCRVIVSSRLIVALQKAERLVYCENCGRILYLLDPQKMVIKEQPKPKSKRGRKPKYKTQTPL
ncbi:MAG: C4-type zinc ribbon domain-containing protein [bacterium]|nr:C4-type zinc ribbon domain-containing protein [bacterium]